MIAAANEPGSGHLPLEDMSGFHAELPCAEEDRIVF